MSKLLFQRTRWRSQMTMIIYWRYYEPIHTYTEPRTDCHYTASFTIVNHLAFCQAWSLNEYVMLCYDKTERILTVFIKLVTDAVLKFIKSRHFNT